MLCEKTALAVPSHSEDLEYASAQVLTRTQPSFHISFFFLLSCNSLSLFKIQSLNAIPSSPHGDTEGWLFARTFGAARGQLFPRRPPLSGLGERGDLSGSRERRGSRKKEQEVVEEKEQKRRRGKKRSGGGGV